MRLRNYKWLLVAGLLVGGYKVYESFPSWQEWVRRHQVQAKGLDRTLSSQVYFLETNRWLRFEVPKDASLVRLISNASPADQDAAQPGIHRRYAIAYELLNGSNGTNIGGVYHFKGERRLYVENESGDPVEINSYLGHGLSPLGGRGCDLKLGDPSQADSRVLRLRLHSSDPELREVAVRVYFRDRVPDRKVGYLWSRLSEDQQRDLAGGNVYSVEGITEAEKRGLLQHHWSAAAPTGIPGTDFERRTLHIRDDSERLRMLDHREPPGVPVDAAHVGILPVTNTTVAQRIELIPGAGLSPTQVVSCELRWHGSGPGIETNSLSGSGPLQIPLAHRGDGFLEVAATQPVHARLLRDDADGITDITPGPVHVLTFTASPTNAVEYVFEHAATERTLVRIDLRRFTPAALPSTVADGVVSYRMLSGDDRVVQTGIVLLTNSLSPHDWLITNNVRTTISAPQSLCFNLDSSVRTLRIDSPHDTVFVNAYSRPAGLAKTVLVPEDYSPARRLRPSQPDWFGLRPLDHPERRAAGQFAHIRVQPLPPEHQPLIEAGEYEWESFLPESPARGQMVLMPIPDGKAQRPENLAFSYVPLETGRDLRVRLQGQPWEREVTPSLMILYTGTLPGSSRITINGVTTLETPLLSPVTRLRLGSLDVTHHRLKVDVDGRASAYLNHVAEGASAAYLQRFCLQGSSNVLTFPYLKRQVGREVLALNVFSPVEPDPQPFRVLLRLKPGEPCRLGPFPELTVLEREARVTPNPDGRAWLVSAAAAELDAGRLVFLPVESDVPPGLHELELQILASTPRWVSLSRTTPGFSPTLKLASTLRNE